jgi:hypothetical protein
MEYFKITDAQRTRLINNYSNTKYKLLKANAAIWFNKICRNIDFLRSVTYRTACNTQDFKHWKNTVNQQSCIFYVMTQPVYQTIAV